MGNFLETVMNIADYTGVFPISNELNEWWRSSVEQMDKKLLEAIEYNLKDETNSTMMKMHKIVQIRLNEMNKQTNKQTNK
ncbi:hypothetical protein COD86_29760 [Bacillus cereus]|nr:hypothetical protein COD14_24755 [Bacillus cereus]PGV87509.1 hypothetical protein COD86_29760 [Bacillus cereus]